MNEIPVTTSMNLENVEDFSNVCRTCATITEFVIPIFAGEGVQNNLADKIHKHLPIQVSEDDVLPRVVCYQCASTLLAWHELVQCCVQADAALRTRLAVTPSLLPEPKESGSQKSLENDQNKFKEIADFVMQSMEPPEYVESSTSPVEEASRTCDYCQAKHTEQEYKDHLVDAHSDLIFHCVECDAYVDKIEFIVHMSLHAVEYTSSSDKKPELKKAKKSKKRKIEDIDVNQDNETKHVQEDEPLETKDQTNNVKNEPKTIPEKTFENEFSDHSDGDYGFEPLPKSVFEAIEDSQDSQTADNGDVPSQNSDTQYDDEPTNHIECSQQCEPEKKTKKHKKNPRTCPICAKVYSASSSYFYHMKYFHRRVKDHECDVCGRKFATKHSLMQHATTHSGSYSYECKECDKKFRSKASLYIHEQIHNGTKRWSCNECYRSFRWRTHLVRHMKRHAKEKDHVCSTCGRGFSVHCDLLRHARTHAAGDYTCEKCDVKFAQLRYLKVHMDKKHSAMIPTDGSVSVSKIS